MLLPAKLRFSHLVRGRVFLIFVADPGTRRLYRSGTTLDLGSQRPKRRSHLAAWTVSGRVHDAGGVTPKSVEQGKPMGNDAEQAVF